MSRGLLIIFPFLAGLGVASITFMLWSANETEQAPQPRASVKSTSSKANSATSSTTAIPALSSAAPTAAASGHLYNQAAPAVPTQAPAQNRPPDSYTSMPTAPMSATASARQSSRADTTQQVNSSSTNAQPDTGGAIVSATVPALSVPFGARVPVAFVADDTPLTPQQADAINRIAEDFNTAVTQSPSDAAGQETPSISEEETWDQARQIADNRYRVLFGDDAANRVQMKSALEALQEKAPVPTLSPVAAPASTPAN